MTTHDAVNHPRHYTSHPSGVEVIELTRHLPFDIGNAVKYVLRRGKKGAPEEDLRKALWYLDDAISHKIEYQVPKAVVGLARKVVAAETNLRVGWFLDLVLATQDGHNYVIHAGVLRAARAHVRLLLKALGEVGP